MVVVEPTTRGFDFHCHGLLLFVGTAPLFTQDLIDGRLTFRVIQAKN